MPTFKVWVDAKRGDDYFYRTKSKRQASRIALKFRKKGMLNSIMVAGRGGRERSLNRKEAKSLTKIAISQLSSKSKKRR